MPDEQQKILLIHPNFPGQFRHLAAHWSKRKDIRLLALGNHMAPGMPGVQLIRYKPPEKQPASHPYLRTMEQAVRVGQTAARAFMEMKRRGFSPDVVIAHPGWGDVLYLRDIFPETRLIHLCEWYYNGEGADTGFDPEFPATLDSRAKIRTWNALHALNLTLCDDGVCPTEWQRSVHPAVFRDKLNVLHEGIDTRFLGPDSQATMTLPNGTNLKAGDPVITYVARNLEPYRGFHHFIRAMGLVQKKHPDCHVLIVGGDGVSYGRAPEDAKNWREKMTREVSLDPVRTHFLGKVPYETYRKILQVSAVHLYLSYPFVLSWSMLEAMACACLVVGADVAPVREVLRHGENGWLVDFFNDKAIAERILETLASPGKQVCLKQQAREEVVNRYSIARGLEGYRCLAGVAG